MNRLNNFNKEQKIIEHCKKKIFEDSNLKKHSLYLSTMFFHYKIQRLQCETEGNETIIDPLDYWQDRLDKYLKNQQNLIELEQLIYDAREILNQFIDNLKKKNRYETKKGGEFDWIPKVWDNLNNLQNRATEMLGISKSDMSRLRDLEISEISKHCIDQKINQLRDTLTLVYINHAQRNLSKISSVLVEQEFVPAGTHKRSLSDEEQEVGLEEEVNVGEVKEKESAIKSVDLTEMYLLMIQKSKTLDGGEVREQVGTNWKGNPKYGKITIDQGVRPIYQEALFKIVSNVSTLMGIDFEQFGKIDFYEFLKLFPYHIRRKIYFADEKDRHERQRELRVHIDEKLTDEQIKELFYPSRYTPSVTKEKIKSELENIKETVVPQLQENYVAQVQYLKKTHRQELEELKEKNKEGEKKEDNYQIIINKILQDYQNDVQELQEKVIKKTEAVLGLYKEVRSWKEDYLDLRSQLGFEQGQNQIIQERLNWTRQTLMNLSNELSSLRKSANIYYQFAEEEMKKLRWEIKDGEDYYIKLFNTNAEWNKQRVDRLEKEKQDLIKIINEKNDELDELEVELGLSEFKNFNQDYNENSEQSECIESAHEDIEKLKREKNTIEQRSKGLDEEYEQLEEAGKRLLNTYQQKEKEIENLSNLLDDERRTGNQIANWYLTLNKQNQTYQSINRSLEEQLIVLQKIAEQEIDGLNKSLDKSYKQNLKEKVITKSYQEQKNIIVEQAKTDRTIYSDALRNKQRKIDDLSSKLVDLNSELTETEEVIEIRNKKVIELNEIIKSQQKEIDSLKKKNGRRDNNIIKLKIKLVERRNDIRTLNKTITEQDEDIANLESVNEDKNRKIIDLTAERDSLKDQILNHTCPPPPVHACPPCSQPHLPTPHVCPIANVNHVNCSHADYDQIKAERDGYKTQLDDHACSDSSCSETDHEKIKLEREREVVEKINAELNLGLSEVELDGLISHLGKLLKKPPLTREIEKIVQDPQQQAKIEQLTKKIIELEDRLKIKIETITVKENNGVERMIVYPLMAILLVGLGASLIKLRSKNKRIKKLIKN